MCIAVVALGTSEEFPFVLAANRDEYFARPSATAAWWSHEGTDIFGGRDLDKGGTWLGLTRAGRIALVTNVRDMRAQQPTNVGSRGWVVRDALVAHKLPPAIARDKFPPYNLLVREGRTLFYARDDADAIALGPGLHGLSNHRIDTPWPKVAHALRALEAATPGDIDALFQILADRTIASDAELPDTGVPREVERALSPICVRMPEVGVVVCRKDGSMIFEERTFDVTGASNSRIRVTLANDG